MRPASKKVNRWLCIPIRLPFKRKKAENEDIQLDRSIRGGPTPAPALKALELKLVEKRDRIAELEQEYRKIKTEADALAVAKKNVEDEIRVAKELLEMREKELDRKDADTQRLEKELSEMQKKRVHAFRNYPHG
ncbi:hypothetical protein BDM02DRAFT_1004929 [Thelephora ganbajun]|uniref:Uncharacterized protein n=1 Tax=Thelephora ganbajun TaxID=370292 RepID=A0ACB6ZNE4_THEGA|nr:hypothetical protein BDM02DRAFT_1004929 [Thelephora ganbajun]